MVKLLLTIYMSITPQKENLLNQLTSFKLPTRIQKILGKRAENVYTTKNPANNLLSNTSDGKVKS
jgi:hypothetical protein